jgi:Leucine-rich repeat (LRR) protein
MKVKSIISFLCFSVVVSGRIFGEDRSCLAPVPPTMGQFYSENDLNICDLQTAFTRTSNTVVGLILSDASPELWPGYAETYTNVVYLTLGVRSEVLSAEVLSACKCFPRLKYLDIRAREIHSISASVSILTNVSHLEYLTIIGKKITSVSDAIYDISTLKCLELFLGEVCLPDGIARLSGLRLLDLMQTRIRCLPSDINRTHLLSLGMMSAPGLDILLPKLPPELISLGAPGCGLRAIPAAWLHHEHLCWLQLNNNQIRTLPEDLTGLPTLHWLWLDDNLITNLPAMRVPANEDLKIRLLGNPIRTVAKANKQLIKKKIIEYDGNTK